jgi:hypothetical protein
MRCCPAENGVGDQDAGPDDFDWRDRASALASLGTVALSRAVFETADTVDSSVSSPLRLLPASYRSWAMTQIFLISEQRGGPWDRSEELGDHAGFTDHAASMDALVEEDFIPLEAPAA